MQYEPVAGENNGHKALKPSEMNSAREIMLYKLHMGIFILILNSLINSNYRGILDQDIHNCDRDMYDKSLHISARFPLR